MDSHDQVITRLKGALDLNELADPQSNGVDFEVEEDELKKEGELEADVGLESFDKNRVRSNICLLSDDEDDNGNDDEYHTELEQLRNKISKIPESDITSDNDGGILKQVKTIGVGPTVPEGALVRVHYNAFTDVGQPAYDSTRLREESKSIRLGRGETIRGLELAVRTMRKHELSRFLIRHDYAYGEMGCPPRIPKRATIIMDVEIVHFVEQEGVDDYYSMNPEERQSRLTIVDIEKVVNAENSEGKEYFKTKNYRRAIGKFRKALSILENYSNKNAQEEAVSNSLRIKACVNCAMCCHHLCHFSQVISYCNQALHLDKKHVKALFYKGKALHSVGSFDDAEIFLKKARDLAPTSAFVTKAMRDLAKSKKDHETFEKGLYKRMFAQTNDKEEDKSAAQEKTTPSKKDETGVEVSNENTCSNGFKDLAKNALETFSKDSSRTEMLFPPMHLNIAEIACIVEIAADLGLDVRSKGTGNALRHEIIKKPKKI